MLFTGKPVGPRMRDGVWADRASGTFKETLCDPDGEKMSLALHCGLACSGEEVHNAAEREHDAVAPFCALPP